MLCAAGWMRQCYPVICACTADYCCDELFETIDLIDSKSNMTHSLYSSRQL